MSQIVWIKQGDRVNISFTQGATVERNVMFLGPDRVTPWPDLDLCSARMEFREFPEDETTIATLTSDGGDIILDASGLIVWELPEEMSAAITAERFGGDLFIYHPDGDAVHVCGYDFSMSISYTRREIPAGG